MTPTDLQGTTKWFGTQAEASAFLRGLAANCACVVTREGARLSVCEPHLMFLHEQRALDMQIAMRRHRAVLLAEEGVQP